MCKNYTYLTSIIFCIFICLIIFVNYLVCNLASTQKAIFGECLRTEKTKNVKQGKIKF